MNWSTYKTNFENLRFINEMNLQTYNPNRQSSSIRENLAYLVNTAKSFENDIAACKYDLFDPLVPIASISYLMQVTMDSLVRISSKQPNRINKEIIDLVEEKDKNYGSSWCARGGVGAFFVSVRKIDRLKTLISVSEQQFAVNYENTDEELWDTVADYYGYMSLILAAKSSTKV